MNINIDAITNLYTDKMVESMFKESVIFPNYQQFLEVVKEYKGLTRRHWKRKRELEPIIASLSIKIASAMEKYLKENPQTVRFDRSNKMKSYKLSQQSLDKGETNESH